MLDPLGAHDTGASIVRPPSPHPHSALNAEIVSKNARIQELEAQVASLSKQLADSNSFERAKIKDTLVGLQYLHSGFHAPNHWTDISTSYQALAGLLALRGLRDRSFTGVSVAPSLSLILGHALPPGILCHINHFLPKTDREKIAKIRCASLSDYAPESVVLRLLDNLDRSKLNRILGRLAVPWGFQKPNNCSWVKYFDSNFMTVRDQNLLGHYFGRYIKFDEYANDRLIVLVGVNRKGGLLSQASVSLRNDRDVVLTAVRNDGTVLKHASMTLRNDPEIVLAAIQQSPYAINCSDALRADRDFMLKAVKQNPEVLARSALGDDREIVLAAVRREGTTLAYASPALRADREIVLAAAKQAGKAVLPYILDPSLREEISKFLERSGGTEKPSPSLADPAKSPAAAPNK